MGPGQCADRAPVKQGIPHPRTYMISTYSNRFNAMHGTLKNTLNCSKNTLWAWCDGAPCVQDGRDPSKANCTCPVLTSPVQTLGGNCDTGNCKYINSAAIPKGDASANDAFAAYMKAHGYPHEPPAQACVPK